MDDVLKVLKAIVSSFSEFGSIPKPVRFCIALFSGVFGFSLIFVYAHLDKTQTLLLAGAIALMLVITAVYYLWNSRGHQASPAEVEWEHTGPAPRETRDPEGAAARPRQGEENFWDAPPRAGERADRPRPAAEQSRREAVTLLELAEPLFQYVCRLNRLGRRRPTGNSGETTLFSAGAGGAGPVGPGLALEEVAVRSQVKALLEDFLAQASQDFRLGQQARKVELPLVFFIDSMIAESALPFAAQWNQKRLAYERQELAGDEKFFDLLDETLKESGEEAAERLGIFYTCIGLGFTGIYFKQPEFLRKTMLGIAPRIRRLAEHDATARICPETYEGVDRRNLVEPPSRRMALVGLVFACFTLAALISYVVMYREASTNLNSSIQQVLRQDLAAAPPP
jgi:type VI secretion system protein ImpK